MKNLNEDLKTGQLKPVYLLYGEEDYLKDMYKQRIKKALLPDEDTMNLTVYRGKGVDIREVISQADTMPFFAPRRMILLESTGLFKGSAGELAEYLPGMPQETVMVFVEDEVDKRGKLYKAVKSCGRAVELGRQDARTLTAWVLGQVKKEKKNLTRQALDLFFQKAGNDMVNISNELEKLFCYTYGRNVIDVEDIQEICTVTTENRIFDMIHAVAEKNQRKALDLYYDLLALKEPPMRILFLIARQFNQLYQIKDLSEQGFDSGGISQKAGIQPFIVKRSLRQTERFEKAVLRQAVEDCVAAEEAVKTGRLGDQLAVEMILVQYSSKKSRQEDFQN